MASNPSPFSSLTPPVQAFPFIDAGGKLTVAALQFLTQLWGAVQGTVAIRLGSIFVRESQGAQGLANLTAGSVVVASTAVTASSRIYLTAQDNTTTGALRVSARVAGTSFTITSSNGADTGDVAWLLLEPAPPP
jgi:hypothetical protein